MLLSAWQVDGMRVETDRSGTILQSRVSPSIYHLNEASNDMAELQTYGKMYLVGIGNAPL